MRFKGIFFLVNIIFSATVAFAFDSKKISIDMQQVSLQDALHILSKLIYKNVVIASQAKELVSLHLQDLTVNEALDRMLATHRLVKWQEGSTWFIASRHELLERKQEELKLRLASEEAAPLATRVWQIHYSKAQDIAHLLQDSTVSLLSSRGHVRVDERTNIVCVQDIEAHMLEINRLIKRLDVPVEQVLIEARLASVDENFERELGINFVELAKEDTVKTKGRYTLAVAKLANNSFLDVQLSALESNGHAELISTPSLFTANQQTAFIESGEEIPYQEVSLSGGTTVAFKKAVLSLKVTPQILPGDKVLLQLQVTQDTPSKYLVLGVPTINTRQVNTNVLIKNNQTLVLGGIYQFDHSEGQQRIPFLGKIPLVGLLFSQQNKEDKKRELLIFVTPRIIG